MPFIDNAEKVLREALDAMQPNPEGLIFYDHKKNGLLTTNQVNCFFQRICEKADIEYNGQHALRHTFATRCIESGISVFVLKKWMGHTDIHVTLDTYADVFDSLNHKSMNMLQEYSETI